MSKIYILFLLLLLSPTYFLDNNNTHDWGDDFAQYLYQAKCLRNNTEPVKKINNINEYGSAKRGVLFSELLAILPSYSEIKPYKQLIFVFYLLSAVVVFMFFSVYFNSFLSLLLTLCIYLNYHVLDLKAIVMPEFVFMFFVYFVFVLNEKQSFKSKIYLISLILGLLTTIRTIGIAFFIAYILTLLLQKEKKWKEKFIDAFKSILVFAVIIFLINMLILPQIHNEEYSFYKNVFISEINFGSIAFNLSSYYSGLQLLFEQEVPRYMNCIIFYSILILISIGIVIRLKSFLGFKEISLVLYLLVLIIFPRNGACIRYLIPLTPLLIYYLAVGGFYIFSFTTITNTYAAPLISIYFLVLILSNSKTIWISFHELKNSYGPYNKEIMADFQKIKTITKPNESIAFQKPFTINLFCDRDSYFYNEINCKIISTKSDYILLAKNKNIDELYDLRLNNETRGKDTLELANFYLIKTK